MKDDSNLLSEHPLPYKVYSGKRMVVTIGGRSTLLRFTPSQQKRHRELMKARDEQLDKAEKVIDRIDMISVNQVKTLEIALNPRPDKIEFTKEDIETLDSNHIGHIAAFWTNEMLAPSLSPLDPALTPDR